MVQWKGRILAGKVDDRPVIQLDILPTALSAAGVPVNSDWKLDGANLLPFLNGQNSGAPHEMLYWRFGPQLALRMGDWKIVKAPGAGVDPQKPRDGQASSAGAHLYNLRQDFAEKENLAEKHPEKFRELVAAWEKLNHEMVDPLWRDGAAERGSAAKGGPKAK